MRLSRESRIAFCAALHALVLQANLQAHQIGERPRFRLVHDLAAMNLDGAFADAEIDGDDLVGLAVADQLGKGVDVFIGSTGNSLCPVAAAAAYMVVRGKSKGPFFRFKDGKPLIDNDSCRLCVRR